MNDFDPLHTRTIKLGLQRNETDLQRKRIGTNGKPYGIAYSYRSSSQRMRYPSSINQFY